MATAKVVTVPEFKRETIIVKLVGDTELGCHQWSEKAKKEMSDKQQQAPKSGRKKRDILAEYSDSLYWVSDKPLTPTASTIEKGTFGFPTIAFKAAAVRAATDAGLKMTDMRRAFHVEGNLVTIESGKPYMREDMVRIGMGADLRYRGFFENWSVNLKVTYNPTVITPEQLIVLFELAGFGVGIGEWRPEKGGSFGRFHVARGDE